MAEGIADRIKAEVSLRGLVERDGVAWDMRRSSVSRGDWWRPCPFHAEATASFHVVEPAGVGGFFKCFGCESKGTVIDYVATRDGVDAAEAIRRLARDAGLERDEDPDRAAQRRADLAQLVRKRAAHEQAEAEWRHRQAAGWWKRATPHAPELRDYLAARGVDMAALERFWPLGVPPSLRYLADHPHYVGCRVAHVGGAMLGFIGRRNFLGVHQTWITPEGRARFAAGSHAGVKVTKKWRGRTGWLYGQPVRLSKPAARMVVGEGIETTLAMLGELVRAGRDDWSAEAALSLGALAGPQAEAGRGPESRATGKPLPSALPDLTAPRPGWRPPDGVASVVVLGEGSEKDPEAAERHGRRAVAKLEALGLEVALAMPGGWADGVDFADLVAAGRGARP